MVMDLERALSFCIFSSGMCFTLRIEYFLPFLGSLMVGTRWFFWFFSSGGKRS